MSDEVRRNTNKVLHKNVDCEILFSEQHALGINVGGHVIFLDPVEWHQLAKKRNEENNQPHKEQSMSDTSIRSLVNISVGGPSHLMPVGDSQLLFEMHPRMGPIPLNKNSSLLKRIPVKFWDAFDRWAASGKAVNDGVCVVPEWCDDCNGSGNRVRKIDETNFEYLGKCFSCDGKMIQQPKEEPNR